MMQRKPHDGDAPSPEILLAFLDGELDEGTRSAVSTWLSEHPEAAAELDSFRQLDQQCRDLGPSEPCEGEWAEVLQRIRSTLDRAVSTPQEQSAEEITPPPRRRLHIPRSRRLLRFAAAVTAAAAILIAFLLLWSRGWNDAGHHDQPLPVASAHDVEIVSMDAADERALVVGVLPLGKFVLAGPGDVLVQDFEADSDEMMQRIRLPDDAPMPMIHVMPPDQAGIGR